MKQQIDLSKRSKFFAFANDAADREVLKGFAELQGLGESCIMQGDISTATEYFKEHPSPVLLLVEIPSAEAAPALLDSLANVCDPHTKVIIIGNVNEYSFYCWLVDIGVFSYLLRPLTKEVLESTYQKSLSQTSQQAVTVKESAKIISVIGARGGVGATTIALNLAGIFAENSGKKIALVDLDPQGGTLSLALDIEPARGLRDALDKPERIDQLFIDRVMSKPHQNLWVLSAEEPMQEYISTSEATAEALIRELADKYDIVILDVPRHMGNFERECLKKSNNIILVAELTLSSLRDTLRFHDLIVDTYKMAAPTVIVNRSGISSKAEMSVADFEKGITTKITEKISYTPDLFMQISGDIPSVINAKHPAMKPLYSLAQHLFPDILEQEEVKKKGVFSAFVKTKEKK